MSGWSAWGENLDALSRVYERPPGARGMVSDAELCLAETYARHSYTGEGKIVELGCWLGAVTLALARGVAANQQSRWQQPIESFDRFQWEAWMTPIAERLGCPTFAHGESFVEHTKLVLEPYRHLIRLQQQDLLEAAPFRDPIEFLFVDAMKSWDLANAITRNYFPRLIAGRALLVQQDFAYHDAVGATNHILMWLVRDRALPVYRVPGSYSVVFFVRQPFDPRELPTLDSHAVTVDTAEQAWEYSMGIVRGESQRDVWLCKVLFFIEQGWLEAAWSEAQRFVNTTGCVTGPAMQDVVDLLARHTSVERPDAERHRLADLRRLLCGA
jgi:hypothetical protein